MKYIKIPNPVVVSPPGAKAVVYDFNKFLLEIVWSHRWWRSAAEGADRHNMLFSLIEKFEKCEPDQWIELSDAEYEAFRPIATMQSAESLPAHLSYPLNMLMRPIFQALDKLPEGSKQPSQGAVEEAN